MLLSSVIFVFYFCTSTAAATLAVFPVKRGRLLDPIECPGPLPLPIPPGFPQFPSLLHMCASRMQHAQNLECVCVGTELICGSSNRRQTQRLIDWCFDRCDCGSETEINRNEFTKKLNYGSRVTFTGIQPGAGEGSRPGVGTFGGDNHPTWNIPTSAHTCSGSCTSVDRQCADAWNGSCKCYAPPVSIFFWHSGSCGSVAHPRSLSFKRDLAQRRRGYYLNATARYASASEAPSDPSPELPAQLASGMLPSPCNASYVSFACSDSPDGIVHEPPQNWLGALLPENATAFPPVPEEFLRIHKLEEGKLGESVLATHME